jgi:hypothetical protein
MTFYENETDLLTAEGTLSVSSGYTRHQLKIEAYDSAGDLAEDVSAYVSILGRVPGASGFDLLSEFQITDGFRVRKIKGRFSEFKFQPKDLTQEGPPDGFPSGYSYKVFWRALD